MVSLRVDRFYAKSRNRVPVAQEEHAGVGRDLCAGKGTDKQGNGRGVREGITQKSQVAELASEGKGETGRERKEREEEKGQERKRVSE